MAIIVLSAYLVAVGYWLQYLNRSYLKQHDRTVPPGFAGLLPSIGDRRPNFRGEPVGEAKSTSESL